MHLAAPVDPAVKPRTTSCRMLQRVTALSRVFVLVLVLVFAFGFAPHAAPAAELTALEISRDEDGVYLSYAVDFELSRSVEEALSKAVPLFFVAEAEVFRDRW